MSKPEIRILQPGDEATLEVFLLPRVESSMFLIGNMRSAGLLYTGKTYSGTYAAAFEDGKINAVVAHYWNDNLVFQAPIHLQKLFQAVIEASQRPIGGLIGPNDQVSLIRAALEIDTANFQMDETENLYSLKLDDLVVPPQMKSGQFNGRRIEPGDLELVTKWSVHYSIEALGEQDTSHLWQRCRTSIERAIEEKSIWILEDHGEPAACSSFNTAIKEVVQVGGVWTPPELRGLGYGRSVVAASLLDAHQESVERAILFTGVSNIAAQKAYLALGFQHIGDYRLILLKVPLGN